MSSGSQDSVSKRRLSAESLVDGQSPGLNVLTHHLDLINKGVIMLQRIRRRNLAFLCDHGIYSPDNTAFIFNVATGVLVNLLAHAHLPNLENSQLNFTIFNVKKVSRIFGLAFLLPDVLIRTELLVALKSILMSFKFIYSARKQRSFGSE